MKLEELLSEIKFRKMMEEHARKATKCRSTNKS